MTKFKWIDNEKNPHIQEAHGYDVKDGALLFYVRGDRGREDVLTIAAGGWEMVVVASAGDLS